MSDKKLLDAEHVARAIFLPVFDVEDKSTTTNKSHAGILLLFGENMLKGDKDVVLKPLPTGVSATGLLLMIQSKLSQLAGKSYIAIDTKSDGEQKK